MAEALQRFFEVNETLVFFCYGLVFFVLGLAIAFQSRRHSRLELAGSLGWLAAFGLAHGMFEWGVIFIPIQATYLSGPLIDFFRALHVFLLAISFGFLFQFGVEMLRRRWPGLVALPLLVTLGWSIWFMVPALRFSPDLDAWHQQAVIWARYLIGFPAGVTAALALYDQAEGQIKPLQVRSIYNNLRLAVLALLTYALLGGLVVPRSGFFPASWLNEASLLSWIGVSAPVFRSLTGLLLTIAMIRALEVFDLELDRMIEGMEIERSLILERERIGRELHDGTIQTIYTAGLLVESALQKLEGQDKVAQRLGRSMEVLNEAITGLRAYISGLRPESISPSLAAAIRAQANDSGLESVIGVQVEVDFDEEQGFNPLRIPHVAAILSEALSNAARHAQARRVKVRAERVDGQFRLVVEDDGQGFQESPGGRGYGLRNMRDRARLLGGKLEVATRPGRGTQVVLTAPWEEEG